MDMCFYPDSPRVRLLADFASLARATLYTYLLEKEMMIKCDNKNGLKGQYNLAQGKRRRSVALGWKTGERIVRAIRIKKEQIIFRTKGKVSDNLKIKTRNSVRMSFSFMKIMLARTVFPLFPLPQALPGARISWPFSPKLVSKEVNKSKYNIVLFCFISFLSPTPQPHLPGKHTRHHHR